MNSLFELSPEEKNRIMGLHLTESKDKRITSVLNEQGTINESVPTFTLNHTSPKSPQEQLHEYLFSFLPEDISDADYPFDTLLEPLLGDTLSVEELEKLKNELTATIFGPDPYDIYREPGKTFKQGESLIHDLMDIQQILAFDKVITHQKEST